MFWEIITIICKNYMKHMNKLYNAELLNVQKYCTRSNICDLNEMYMYIYICI
jgi:hypothetical protein